jgi:hypothetical protein
MNTYEIFFTVSCKDLFPCDKVKNSDRYEILCDHGAITTVTIKRVVAEEVQTAISKGESELRGLLGLFLLKLGKIVKYEGGRRIDRIDEHGNRVPEGVRSNSVIIRVTAPPLDIDLLHYQATRNSRTEFALSLYLVAVSLSEQRDWAGAFLNMFLTLETLLTGKLSVDQKKYRYIRHGIAHYELDPKKAAAPFLKQEFGSERPDWQASGVQSRLLNWYNKLQKEVTQLLNEELN